MAQCCNNCFTICQPLASCPAAVYVYAPLGSYESGILVNVMKPGVNVQGQQLLNVAGDGFVEIDLEALPVGFFNPYGGQYNLNFVNPQTNQAITFTATDGKEYDSICLTFTQVVSNQETVIAIINPINNEQPEL